MLLCYPSASGKLKLFNLYLRISGRILQLETVTQSEAMRKRYRFLSHFSLTTTLEVCSRFLVILSFATVLYFAVVSDHHNLSIIFSAL